MIPRGRKLARRLLLALPFVALASAADEALVRATVAAPVTISAAPLRTASSEPTEVVVSVVGYTPSPSGPVQAVVTYDDNGAPRELGRFGIFPQSPFDPKEPAKTQRFGFPLPESLDPARSLKLTIRVQPTLGSGEGAVMTFGKAEIL